MEGLAQRLAAVRERLRNACTESGRSFQSVTLVAVSKRKSAALIRDAYALGLRDFGENYAQELRDKAKELADLEELRWHFIGPLQRNKVKYVAAKTTLLHTLSAQSVATELDRRASAAQRVQPILVQVNISGESAKSGLDPAELGEFLEQLQQFQFLRCDGLMTMPPAADDPQQIRPVFRELRRLLNMHASKMGPTFKELSMGMSHDFEAAIAEGATLVRVGSSLFGPRD